MKIKETFCNVLSNDEREYNNCMQNATKFISIKTLKFMGKIALNVGAKKIIEYLPTLVV